MNPTILTALQQIAFACVGGVIVYVTGNLTDLGNYGPYLLAGLQALQTIINVQLGKPTDQAITALSVKLKGD